MGPPSQDDYLVQFDDIKVKLSLQCQLTLRDRTDPDRYLDGTDKTYYVYDSRVCRFKAMWIKAGARCPNDRTKG